jgi:hypothetical protein
MSAAQEEQRKEHNSPKPPPYLQYHDPQTLHFPSVPETVNDASAIIESKEDEALVSSANLNDKDVIVQNHLHIRNLLAPARASVPTRLDQMEQLLQEQQKSLASTLSDTPIMAVADDVSMVMDMDSVASPDERAHRAGSVISMDDPDVRIAAEALGDLRAGELGNDGDSFSRGGRTIEIQTDMCLDGLDFIQSPSNRSHSSFSKNKIYTPLNLQTRDTTLSIHPHPEPLLSLFTSSHPILGTAINGSLSAYTSSKSYSPSFKYGAEFVERHIGTPVVSTVGTVGRRTGVEVGMRWWLGDRHSRVSEEEFEDQGSSKRRRVGDVLHGADIEKGLNDSYTMPASSRRRPSEASFADSLPAYDDHRSPDYEAQVTMMENHEDDSSTANPNWQRRLMLSTSGLGVAMSEESLRSLKYCLTWLRWANIHLGKVIFKLKDVLVEWDQSQIVDRQIEGNSREAESEYRKDPTQARMPTSAETEEALSTRIQTLKSDVLQTLKKVVDIVSTYAGGALPENARLLVRRHLTSLPQRFMIASGSNPPNTSSAHPAPETVSSAHRVMVLAQEGLDMMAQVSGVLDGTIVSAEEWCERLGRRKPTVNQTGTGTTTFPGDEKASVKAEEGDADVVMGGEDEKKM